MSAFRHHLCLLGWLFFFTATVLASDNKSGVSANVVSLPSGPGSIEGLGEAFQPTLNTGTGKHAVTLKLPPGPAGRAPKLALIYDGGSGNSAVGIGWSLPMSYVQRQTDKGVPRYVDAANSIDDDHDGVIDNPEEIDRFINESSEELVPVQQGGNSNFFCKNEGTFIRYRRIADYWEGRLPDGTRLVFGESASARISDPTQATRIFRWLLEKQIDTNGNTIRYRYATFPGPTNSGNVYLRAIEYGPGAPGWGGKFHFAFFEYEDRTDWFEDCRAGFPVRTGKRLSRVVVGTQGVTLAGHLGGDFNGDGAQDSLNRIYQVSYLPASPFSLVSSVTMVGADGVSVLPSSTYGYTMCHEADTISAAGHLGTSIGDPSVVFDQSTTDLIDLNGDGLPDILRTYTGGGAHQVYINQGEQIEAGGVAKIKWTAANEVAQDPGGASPWDLGLHQDAVVLADVDGDGLSDLVQMTFANTYYFRNQPQTAGPSRWGPRKLLEAVDFIPPSPFGTGDSVRMLDVNFDKRTDIIRSVFSGGTYAYQVWFNLGGNAFSERVTVSPTTGYNFADKSVQLADLNGDRLMDVARIRPTEILFAASLGNGNFLDEESITIPGATLDPQQIEKASLKDVNGDGLADLVIDRPEPREVWIWPNRGNRTFGSRIRVTGLPPNVAGTVAIRWADINGNGTTDLVFGESSEADGQRITYLDLGRLQGCVPRPYLLNHVTNGIGRSEEIDYASSTDYALRDGTVAGTYQYSWPHPLPFPVQVISEVRTGDSLGSTYTTRFTYHDGYYDPVEKQFRGFGRVEQTELGDARAPTLATKFTFDTGAAVEVLKGKILRQTSTTEGGAVFSDASTVWQVRQLYAGSDGRAVAFANPQSTVTDLLELGQGTARRFEQEFTYDLFGNQTALTDYGVVVGGDRSAFNDERVVATNFAYNLTDWLLRFPKRQEVRALGGAVISRKDTFYDDESFGGGNAGLVSKGNVTLVRESIDPANGAGTINSSRTRFDPFGNPINLLDPLLGQEDGHWREIAFDPDFHTFPVTETIHVGGGSADLVVQAGYDRGFGTVTSSLDFNGNGTTYNYDVFARLKSIIRPGDDAQNPTAEYDYALAVPAGAGLVNFVETRTLDNEAGAHLDRYFRQRQFVDGLGRQLMSKEEAGGGVYAVKNASLFNARRKPSTVLNPFYSASFDYESIAAPGWQGQFTSGNGLVSLGLGAADKSSTFYDAQLRPLRTIVPDGNQSQVVYEPLVERHFDEEDSKPGSIHAGTPMVHYKDGLGRLIAVEEVVKITDSGDPGGLATWRTSYAYDLNDQLTRIQDSQNNVKTMLFDGLKRMTSMNDPDRGAMTFAFDDASNLHSTLDAKGQRIVYAYDGANRIQSEDYQDGSPRVLDVEYHYDSPAPGLPLGDGTIGAASNVKGQLAWVRDLSGETHFSFDSRARLSWEVKRIPDRLHGQLVSYRTRFDHDNADRLTRLTYPDGDEIHHSYNSRSLLDRIYGAALGDVIGSLAYRPSGQMASIGYGNGVATSYAYDSRLRLSHLATISPSAGPLIDFGYQFDGVSNITRIEDGRTLAGQPQAAQRFNTQVFGYDSLYRLTRVDYPGLAGADPRNVEYRYDRIGNMLRQTSDIASVENGLPVANLGVMDSGGAAGRSGRTGRAPADPPGPHALTRITGGAAARDYEYDANGNMRSIDGLACTWDFKDRLVAVENAQMRATYTYDYTDRRITKTVTPKNNGVFVPASATATQYVNQYFEIRDYDAPVKYVWNGATRVARVTAAIGAATRTQHLRLSQGWNLVALTVGGQLPALDPAQNPSLSYSGFWSSAVPGNGMVSITATTPVPAGVSAWILATQDATIVLAGTPAPQSLPALTGSGQMVANTFDEPLDLGTIFPANAWLWSYDTPRASWQTRFPSSHVLSAISDAPPSLLPGKALWTTGGVPGPLPDTTGGLSVRYYHQDHLGSSSVMSDATGALVEESANYPFGSARSEFRPRGTRENYQFTQKEHDSESGLHYFEARFLATSLGRFLSPDPLSIQLKKESLFKPQTANLYSYVDNRPNIYTDHTGLFPSWIFEYHQQAVGRALADTSASATDINILKGAVGEADSDHYADPRKAYRHAMSDGRTRTLTSTDGSGAEAVRQTPEAAHKQANLFVRRELLRAGHYESSGNHELAMRHVGFAIHALQDAASPEHHGFKGYKGEKLELWSHVLGELFYPGPGSNLDRATKMGWNEWENVKSGHLPAHNKDFFRGIEADHASDPNYPGPRPQPCPIPDQR